MWLKPFCGGRVGPLFFDSLDTEGSSDKHKVLIDKLWSEPVSSCV